MMKQEFRVANLPLDLTKGTIRNPRSTTIQMASELGMLGNKSFTLEAKIKIDSWDTSKHKTNDIVGIDDHSLDIFDWSVVNRKLTGGFCWPDGPMCQEAEEIQLSTWYHVAIIFETKRGDETKPGYCEISLYRDGVITASVKQGTKPRQRDGSLKLGGYMLGLQGELQQLKLWNCLKTVHDLKHPTVWPLDMKVFTCQNSAAVINRAKNLGMLGDASFTLEAKIYINAWNVTQQGDNAIVGIDDYGIGTFHWVVRWRKLTANFYGPPGCAEVEELQLKTWYHIAVIYTVANGKGTMSLYRDGVIKASHTADLPPARDCTLQLGRYASGRCLNGMATQVRLTNRALSIGELHEGKKVAASDCTLTWGELASIRKVARFTNKVVVFGRWSTVNHRYAAPEVQAAVMTVLMMAQCDEYNLPKHPSTTDSSIHFWKLPYEILFVIFSNLPLEYEN